MRRHELTDAEWERLKGFFPANGGRGRPWNEHRSVLNGLFWRLRTGAPWRDIPERYGPWQTIYDRFNRYRREGTWDRILEALQIRLDAQGLIDWDLWCVDGSSIRASRAAAGAGKKGETRSRRTTHWVAAEADSQAKSTWFLTARALRWPCTSPRGRHTNRRSSRKA